jgi:hypothetical protein
MIATVQSEREAQPMGVGHLIVYVGDHAIDDAVIATVKHAHPSAILLADLLEPLYDASIPTREAAHTLGRLKAELESMVQEGTRVVVLCRRRSNDLGTRSHFLTSLCTSADRVHFLKST